MASNPLRPCAKPELLLIGKTYQVEHELFGRFIARAEEPHFGWCGFVIIEGNDRLRASKFDDGTYVEMTSGFFKARPLS